MSVRAIRSDFFIVTSFYLRATHETAKAQCSVRRVPLLGARTIGAVAAHLSYVSQRGALEFETDEGQREPKEGCVLTAPPMLISHRRARVHYPPTTKIARRRQFQIPDAHHRWLRVIIRRLDRRESR
jgi:hypothetical protein